MVQDRIEREIVINAPRERVWSALTEAQHLGTWFGDAGAEIDLRPGGKMAVRWKDHGLVLCQVEQVEPPHRFAYRWGSPGATEPNGDNSTLVEFTLTSEGTATRLHVVESGFLRLPVSDDAKLSSYNDNTEGWTSETDELAAYLENFSTIPNQIERETVIAAPIERVWAILTEPAHFQAWFAFDGAEIELRPGGRMVMTWKEHGRFLATVERVEPPYVFAFRGSRLPDDPVGQGNSTHVVFTLTPTAAGTLLRVVESGFRDLLVSEEEKAEAVNGNIQGWIGAFSELTAYTERLAA